MTYQAFFNHLLQTPSQKGSKQEKSDETSLFIKKYILIINNNTVF